MRESEGAELVITTRCTRRSSGQHAIGTAVWNDRVLARVATCECCGEQWIVREATQP